MSKQRRRNCRIAGLVLALLMVVAALLVLHGTAPAGDIRAHERPGDESLQASSSVMPDTDFVAPARDARIVGEHPESSALTAPEKMRHDRPISEYPCFGKVAPVTLPDQLGELLYLVDGYLICRLVSSPAPALVQTILVVDLDDFSVVAEFPPTTKGYRTDSIRSVSALLRPEPWVLLEDGGSRNSVEHYWALGRTHAPASANFFRGIPANINRGPSYDEAQRHPPTLHASVHWCAPGQVTSIISMERIQIIDVLHETKSVIGPFRKTENAGSFYSPLLAHRVTPSHLVALTLSEMIVCERRDGEAMVVQVTPFSPDWLSFPPHGLFPWSPIPRSLALAAAPITLAHANGRFLCAIALSRNPGSPATIWQMVLADAQSFEFATFDIDLSSLSGFHARVFTKSGSYFCDREPPYSRTPFLYDVTRNDLYVVGSQRVPNLSATGSAPPIGILAAFHVGADGNAALSAIHRFPDEYVLQVGPWGQSGDIAVLLQRYLIIGGEYIISTTETTKRLVRVSPP